MSGFDDYGEARECGDESVAFGKGAACGACARRLFGEEQSVARNALLQAAMVGWICDIEACADDSAGGIGAVECTGVCGGVDTAG